MSTSEQALADTTLADLVITGGLVVDGTGSPGILADVAVTDGRITAIGQGLRGGARSPD